MSMWILAILLLLVFAAIGFGLGAIRASISLAGLIIALLVAVPLGGVLRPLLGMAGVTNPVWLSLVPPVVAFLLVYLAIMGLSFFAHHKVYLMYKYKRDDVDRMRWERMNRRAGAALGVLSGGIMVLVVAGVIYAAGYLTVQLSAEENNPATIKFINAVREDMAETGFDKAAARFQPAPPIYYDAADVLGLLYHNPLLQSRLVTYPYFLSLGERPEFQEIGNDKEYNDLIFGKAPVTAIIEHPRTQSLLSNDELLNYLKGTDLKDLKEYLRTGKSSKYEDQEILGVWNLDKAAMIMHARKANPDIKSKDLRGLMLLLAMVPDISLVATPENKVIFRSGGAAPQPAAEEPPQEQTPEVDPNLVSRYGEEQARRMAGLPPAQAAAPQPAEQAPASPVTSVTSGEGTWQEESAGYSVRFTDANGKETKGNIRIKGDEMLLTIANTSLVFFKQ